MNLDAYGIPKISCPHCHYPAYYSVVHTPRYSRVITCTNCGFFEQLVQVRDKADVANDRGIYKYMVCGDVWGYVVADYRNGTSLAVAVDVFGSKTFIPWLADHIDEFISVRVSRVKNNVVIVEDLINILK